MDYNKICEKFTSQIKSYNLSHEDLELFKEFLTHRSNIEQLFNKTDKSDEENLQNLIGSWFKFMQDHGRYPKKDSLDPNIKPETYIYRATFGNNYTLSQLATSPLRYSKGSNGSGLYATTSDKCGTNYLKHHLKNRYHAFKDEKVGHILKIGLREDSIVMDKMSLGAISQKIIKEIQNSDLSDEYKYVLSRFIASDISIISIFFGVDLLYLPTGHVLVLNKDSLMFPKQKNEFNKQTLRIDLERFRNNDKSESERIEEFLQR